MKKNYLLPIVILSVAVLGCTAIRDLASKATNTGSSSNSNSPSNSGNPSKSSAAANPKEAIIEASKKFIELPAFSAKMEGDGERELRMQVDYVAPDRYRIRYLNGTAAGMETIMIGKTTYMKAGGTWRKMEVNLGGNIPTLRDSFTEEGLKTLSDVKFEGDDTVDGKAALAYSYKNVTPKDQYSFTSKIWIAKESGLPMKIEVNYENGTLK